MDEEDLEQRWLSVIGRSLAFLCLAEANIRDKDLATQVHFLEGLALARRDAAALLGTTEPSLRELMRLARKRKGGKRSRKSKAR